MSSIILKPANSGITGPTVATDNGIVCFDGTTGKKVQNRTNVVIDDSGNVGIGTVSPGKVLDIANPTLAASMEYLPARVRDNTVNGLYLGFFTTAGSVVQEARLRSGGGIPLSLGTTTYPQAIYVLNTNGHIGFGTTAPASIFEVVSQESAVYPFFLSAYAGTPVPGFVGRSARGTLASPTATQINDYLFSVAGRAHTGSAFETSSPVLIAMKAAENHSATNQGAYILFETTPAGSTAGSRTERVRILAGGEVGIGEAAPETLLEMTSTAPYITIHNSTEEDIDGGREGKIIFKGEQSGGEESVLVVIQASHDGASDDEKADFIVSVNDGNDGSSPTERLRIDSAGLVTVTGTINMTVGNVLKINAVQVVGAQAANIVAADGSLADITTKFNTLLGYLKTHGLLASV
jgi:hypothetical protein